MANNNTPEYTRAVELLVEKEWLYLSEKEETELTEILKNLSAKEKRRLDADVRKELNILETSTGAAVCE